MKNDFQKKQIDSELISEELDKANRQHFMCPIPLACVYSAENAFFKMTGGRFRFLQDVRLLNLACRAPKFKMRNATDVINHTDPKGYIVTFDVKNCYQTLVLSVLDKAQACFAVTTSFGEEQYYINCGGYYGNRYLCAYSSDFIATPCNILNKLMGSFFSAAYCDDCFCQVAILDGVMDFHELLGERLLAETLNIPLIDVQNNAEKYRIDVSKMNFQYKNNCEKLDKKVEENFKNCLALAPVEMIAKKLAFVYCNEVRNFVLRLVNRLGFPLNEKSQLTATQHFKYLGFYLDIAEKTLHKTENSIIKLSELLDKIFTQNSLSVQQAMVLLGLLQSLQVNDVALAHFRTEIAFFIAQIHRKKELWEKTLPLNDLTQQHPVPDEILKAVLEFLHNTDNFFFSPIHGSQKNVLILNNVHPKRHYMSKKKYKEACQVNADCSDYAIGSYFTFKDNVSPLSTLHLPVNYQGDEAKLGGFHMNSTSREIYGVLQSLKSHLENILDLKPPALRLTCDNKAAAWMIFSGKGSNSQNNAWIHEIRALLSKHFNHIPVQIIWLRRDRFEMFKSDLGSKYVSNYSIDITPFFKNKLKDFNVPNLNILGKMPHCLMHLRSPHLKNKNDLPLDGRPFLVSAPLNVSKATAVFQLLENLKRPCIAIFPRIFYNHYYKKLRQNYEHFECSYTRLFHDVPFAGFNALVVKMFC